MPQKTPSNQQKGDEWGEFRFRNCGRDISVYKTERL